MTTDWTHNEAMDLRGLACPLPTLKARKRLARMDPGARLLIEATDPMAAIDIPHMCNEDGHRLIVSETAGGVWRFLLECGN